MKKIFIASDHAGFDAKKALVELIKEKGHVVDDLGPHTNESCHYPTYAVELARKMQAEEDTLGILLCGSGIGVSMVANRFRWIRGARCVSLEDARLAKAHNNANVLCLGARINSLAEMKAMTEIWLATSFEGGRHEERVSLFNQLGI
jgi:ribose 5-phosphate isomerase B